MKDHMTPTGQPGEWWHWVHHAVPAEPLRWSVAVRHAYVRAAKPAHEIPVRLAAMQPVKDPTRLPAQLIEAARAYGKAAQARDEAWQAYDAAQEATVA